MNFIVLLFVGLAAGANLRSHGHGHGHGHAYGHLHHDSSHHASTLNADSCGKPAVTPYPPRSTSSYIIGGSEAAMHSFPWQVALYDGSYYICGGSLVYADTKLVVVTAAHCVDRNRRYKVAVGAHDRTGSLSFYNVQTVILHEGYNTNTIENDIAVLVLAADVPVVDKTHPICISQTDPELYVNHTQCLVSGWGTTHNGGLSNTLQYVYKPVLSKETCKIVTGFKPSNMICAGFLEGGKDSCQGDSGGPFVCHNSASDKWELVGIVSWGYGCAQANSPGVYSDVFALNSWLKEKLTGI